MYSIYTLLIGGECMHYEVAKTSIFRFKSSTYQVRGIGVDVINVSMISASVDSVMFTLLFSPFFKINTFPFFSHY